MDRAAPSETGPSRSAPCWGDAERRERFRGLSGSSSSTTVGASRRFLFFELPRPDCGRVFESNISASCITVSVSSRPIRLDQLTSLLVITIPLSSSPPASKSEPSPLSEEAELLSSKSPSSGSDPSVFNFFFRDFDFRFFLIGAARAPSICSPSELHCSVASASRKRALFAERWPRPRSGAMAVGQYVFFK